jgi:hypothetical protein
VPFIRVVRFTDVDLDRVKTLTAEVEQADGPPEGAPTTGLSILVDDDQRTAVVLQYYDSKEDLREGDRAFGAMDPGETPGSRASVDMTELKLERRLGG